MKLYNASALILEIEDNRVLCSRGDIVLAFKIDYPEKYSQSEIDFATIHDSWVRALRNLPSGTILVKSDVYTKAKYDASDLPSHSYLQRVTQRYFEGRDYMRHEGYAFFVYTKLDTLKNDAIKNPFIFPDHVEFDKEDIVLQSFISEVEQAVELIGKSNLVKLRPLNANEINNFRDFYFNGFQANYLTDLEIEKDRIRVDNQQVGIFTIGNEKYLPDSITPAIEDGVFSSKEKGFVFYEGFLDSLGMTLPCSHIYNQILYVDDHRAHLGSIQKNLEHLKGMRRFSPENQVGADRLEQYLKDVGKDTSFKYVRGHNNVIFWTENDQEFEHFKRQVSIQFKSHDIKPAYPTGERLREVFYNSFFTNVSCLSNENLYLLDLRASACLFITNTNYKNDREGVIFNDRIYNIPVIHDTWDAGKKRKKSKSFGIIAPTGSGKSVTGSHLFRQFIENGTVSVIIDLGNSYIKMAKLFPPEQVAIFNYVPGEPLGLNPFALESGEELTDLKIEELCQFVWSLIKKEDHPTNNEETSLRKIIKHYYVTEDEYTWVTFYDFIKTNKDRIRELTDIAKEDYFDVQQFLHVGSDFIGEGIYAKLFETTKDITSSFTGKNLIIFELDKVKENKMLLSIMLQMISEAIQRTIWNDRTRRGVVLYEELAEQLKFPQVLQRVRYQTQAIRKQNGAVGIVLQTLSQLPDTPGGKSILENLETFIVLQGGNYETTINRLKLNDHDRSQLYSLASKFDGERRYSELYIKEGNYGNVFRIELPREVFLAYQTEGEIHDELMAIYDRTQSMEEAINEYMSNH